MSLIKTPAQTMREEIIATLSARYTLACVNGSDTTKNEIFDVTDRRTLGQQIGDKVIAQVDHAQRIRRLEELYTQVIGNRP